MAQPMHGTLETVVPFTEWDASEVLNFRPRQDGSITCSGVKKGSSDNCQWKLGPDAISRITGWLDDMGGLPPNNAVQFLRSLADVSLCHNHKAQATVKVAQWKSAINAFAQSAPGGYLTTGGPVTAPLQNTAPFPPQSTPPTSSSSYVPSQSSFSQATPSQRSHVPPSSSGIDRATEDRLRLFELQVAALTARIATLEAGQGVSIASTPLSSPPSQPSSRSGRPSFFRKSGS